MKFLIAIGLALVASSINSMNVSRVQDRVPSTQTRNSSAATTSYKEVFCLTVEQTPEEEAAKKKAEEEAAEEEAAKQRAEEEAAKQKAEEEAAKQKAEEEAAKKKAEEEAAKKKAEEEAAKKKAAEDKASAESLAERATASLARSKSAVKAIAAAQSAVDAQAESNKALLERTREADKAASTAAAHRAAAEKAKAEESSEAAAAEAKARASKTAADTAAVARSDAELVAEQKSIKAKNAIATAEEALSRAQKSLSTQTTFHWILFLLLALLFSSVFILSALAFWHWVRPVLVEQLRNDYTMLGVQQDVHASTGRQEPDKISKKWLGSFFPHCLLAIFAASAGAALFCWRPAPSLLDINTQNAMQLGFLGAYVFCMNLVYRRYTTHDLQPHVYLSCAVGLIAGMVFNYVAFTAIDSIANSTSSPDNAEFKGVGAGAAAILAFSLGYFPNLAIRWFGRISRTSLAERQRRSDALPLSLIDGISELHESRLRDEGIDNVQNLAAVDILALVEKSPYSAQQIVEWVDQALLYLYMDPGEIDSFRRAGVRSVTDFRDVWRVLFIRISVDPDGTVKQIPLIKEEDKFDDRRKSIAQQLATTELRLDCLLQAIEEGPNMELVRTYWRNVQNANIEIRNRFINQVCGSVGRRLQESLNEGTSLNSGEILSLVARSLFAAADASGKVNTVSESAESLRGQAYLKDLLNEVSQARQLLLQCIDKFPEYAAAYNGLAWLDLLTRSRKSDFMVARSNAAKAIRLVTKEKENSEKAIKQAKELAAEKREAEKKAKKNRKAAKEETFKAEAEKAEALQEAIQAVINEKTSDLASYLDTLALAEIRLGKLKEGEKTALEAIKRRKESMFGNEPRLLETLVEAAEKYLSKDKTPTDEGETEDKTEDKTEDETEADRILKYVEKRGYASAETRAKIAQLRVKVADAYLSKAKPTDDDITKATEILAILEKQGDTTGKALEQKIAEQGYASEKTRAKIARLRVKIADAYLSKAKPTDADMTKAKEVLAILEKQGDASKKTREKIAQLREDHDLDPSA